MEQPPFDVNLDFGNVSGSFVRLDLSIVPWESQQQEVAGFACLSAAEARQLAGLLSEAAAEVERLGSE